MTKVIKSLLNLCLVNCRHRRLFGVVVASWNVCIGKKARQKECGITRVRHYYVI